MEDWIAENGSGPTLDNFNGVIEGLRGNDGRMCEMDRELTSFRRLFSEYMEEKELLEDWNQWLEEKNNAVQNQQEEEENPEEEEE